MLKRTDESYVSVDEMKQQPEWQATINAMLEYGEIQALRIQDVSNKEVAGCDYCRDEQGFTIGNMYVCDKCGRQVP